VPARDIQLILGHSRVTTTQEIYQHDDLEDRRKGLGSLQKLLGDATSVRTRNDEVYGVRQRSRQELPSTWLLSQQTLFDNSGGDTGTRTPDLLHAISIHSSVDDRVTEMNRIMNVRRRSWLLGLVAVRIAVKK
jgi:hypothetical protein